MRRGCISLGQTQCDECQRIIPLAERYLALDEEGAEAERRKTIHYCVECALKQGYAYQEKGEGGEKILTFFRKY